jgi:hypothetical protein
MPATPTEHRDVSLGHTTRGAQILRPGIPKWPPLFGIGCSAGSRRSPPPLSPTPCPGLLANSPEPSLLHPISPRPPTSRLPSRHMRRLRPPPTPYTLSGTRAAASVEGRGARPRTHTHASVGEGGEEAGRTRGEHWGRPGRLPPRLYPLSSKPAPPWASCGPAGAPRASAAASPPERSSRRRAMAAGRG